MQQQIITRISVRPPNHSLTHTHEVKDMYTHKGLNKTSQLNLFLFVCLFATTEVINTESPRNMIPADLPSILCPRPTPPPYSRIVSSLIQMSCRIKIDSIAGAAAALPQIDKRAESESQV